jgi:hypothetical protein
MDSEVVKAGRGKNIKTSGLYLSILDSSGAFEIRSPKTGTLAGKVGRQFVLDGINEVQFFNTSDVDVSVEYESANIRIYGAGSGGVNIENTPSIQKIIEPIVVNATSTVEDGKMRLIRANVLTQIEQITLAPNEVKLFIAARERTSRKVTIQVISANATELRIGSDNTLTATQGGIIKGSIDAIASAVIENTSAIWLINNSQTETATVTGFEEYRP